MKEEKIQGQEHASANKPEAPGELTMSIDELFQAIADAFQTLGSVMKEQENIYKHGYEQEIEALEEELHKKMGEPVSGNSKNVNRITEARHKIESLNEILLTIRNFTQA